MPHIILPSSLILRFVSIVVYSISIATVLLKLTKVGTAIGVFDFPGNEAIIMPLTIENSVVAELEFAIAMSLISHPLPNVLLPSAVVVTALSVFHVVFPIASVL
jgi:hypothetical protein